jgi:hypothetical protein
MRQYDAELFPAGNSELDDYVEREARQSNGRRLSKSIQFAHLYGGGEKVIERLRQREAYRKRPLLCRIGIHRPNEVTHVDPGYMGVIIQHTCQRCYYEWRVIGTVAC